MSIRRPSSSRTTGTGRLAAVLVVLVALVATACGSNDTSDSAADEAIEVDDGFVGTVSGTDAFIAVVVTDGDGGRETAVYVCDGGSEISAWFSGPVEDPTSFELTNAAGASVSATLSADGHVGTFTDLGVDHSFTTVPAQGEGGLYRLVGEEAIEHQLWGGWIVDNVGEERGAFLRRRVFLPTPRFPGGTLRFDEADALFGTRTNVNLSGTQFSVSEVNAGDANKEIERLEEEAEELEKQLKELESGGGG